MKFLNILLLISTVILIVGCASKAPLIKEDCEVGEIFVAGACCADNDGNDVCDEFELRASPQSPNTQDTQTVKDTDSVIESEETTLKPKFLNVTQLETEINLTFARQAIPFHAAINFVFDDEKRENLTGIENSYDVRVSTKSRFRILKLKKEYDFLHNYENFTDFVNKSAELVIKNNKIWAGSVIDEATLYTEEWKGAVYDYDHYYNETEVNGTKVIYVWNTIIFSDSGGYFLGAWGVTHVMIWCTPESIVDIYPEEISELGWNSGVKSSDMERNIIREELAYKPELVSSAEKLIPLCKKTP